MRSHQTRSRSRANRSSRWPVVLALLGVLVLAGCAGGNGRERSAEPADVDDPGFGHVHGLGWSDRDESVYAASHYGVWRIRRADGQAYEKPVRVAGRYQDTMGFAVAAGDAFYGSGHPDMRENLPGLLGFLVSDDRARTWTPVSLLGEVDLHDIAVAGEQVYAWDSTSGRLLASDDEGRTWRSGATGQFLDLTADPALPSRVIATSPAGVVASADAGGTFRPVRGAPSLTRVDWGPSAGGTVLAGVDDGGSVWVASAGQPEGPWEQVGTLGQVEAFDVVAADRFLAADDSGVKESTDGGRTWSVIAAYDRAQ